MSNICWSVRQVFTVALTVAAALLFAPALRAADKWQLEEVYRFDKGGSIYDVAFIKDGPLALIGSDPTEPTLEYWNLDTREFEKSFDLLAVFLAVSPSGELAAFSDFSPTAKLMRLNAPNAKPEALFHGEFVTCIAFSRDGRLLATGGRGGTACIWDVEKHQELIRFRDHESGVSGVVFSPDSKLAYSISEDKTLRAWDVATATEKLRIDHKERLWSMAITPDGRHVLTGVGGPLFGNPLDLDVLPIEENPIRIWNAETGELVRELKGHTNVVRKIDVSADGKLICTGSFDHTIRIWDFETGKELARAEGKGWAYSTIFSPDAKFVLVGGGVERLNREWIQSPEERLRLFRLVPGSDGAAQASP